MGAGADGGLGLRRRAVARAFLAAGAGSTPAGLRASASGCSSSGSGSSIFLYGSGVKLVSETDLPLCATGRLTVTFAGDPAAGCAAHGLCGYAGTETWQPQNVGDVAISTFEQRGRRFSSGTMIIGGPGNPVLSAVQHSQATGTTTACSDQSQGGGGFFSLPVSAGRVTIGLGHAEQPLLGTRCAGPLAYRAHHPTAGSLEADGDAPRQLRAAQPTNGPCGLLPLWWTP